MAVGAVAGVVAALFRWLIGLFHSLFFPGKISVFYDANLHTPTSPWGIWVILAPAIGGLMVLYLVRRFAPEAKGHGAPEVMDAIDAIYCNKGVKVSLAVQSCCARIYR